MATCLPSAGGMARLPLNRSTILLQMLLNSYNVSRLPTGHNGLIANRSDEELLVKSELPRYPGHHFSWPWLLRVCWSVVTVNQEIISIDPGSFGVVQFPLSRKSFQLTLALVDACRLMYEFCLFDSFPFYLLSFSVLLSYYYYSMVISSTHLYYTSRLTSFHFFFTSHSLFLWHSLFSCNIMFIPLFSVSCFFLRWHCSWALWFVFRALYYPWIKSIIEEWPGPLIDHWSGGYWHRRWNAFKA